MQHSTVLLIPDMRCPTRACIPPLLPAREADCQGEAGYINLRTRRARRGTYNQEGDERLADRHIADGSLLLASNAVRSVSPSSCSAGFLPARECLNGQNVTLLGRSCSKKSPHAAAKTDEFFWKSGRGDSKPAPSSVTRSASLCTAWDGDRAECATML